jgi:hypothetical protein
LPGPELLIAPDEEEPLEFEPPLDEEEPLEVELLLDDEELPDDVEAPGDAPEEDDELLELEVELLVEADGVEVDDPEPPQPDRSIAKDIIPQEIRAAQEAFLQIATATHRLGAGCSIELSFLLMSL